MTAPVIFIIFNRPAETRRTFATIRSARPEKLFIIADGPRTNRPGEAELCAQTRAIVDEIDWPCEVLKNFAEDNMGCGRRIWSGLTWAFSIVPAAIILEDDCVADASFFPFCTELLQRYRDNPEIAMISGNNFQTGISRTEDSYYFSRLAHCWGWATWARAWSLCDFDMKWWPTVQGKRWLKSIARYPLLEVYWEREFERAATGALNVWGYKWVYTMFSNNLLSVVPAQNLVENVGFGPEATHTKHNDGRHVQPAARIMLPLRHPRTIEVCEEADNFERLYLHQLSRVDT